MKHLTALLKLSACIFLLYGLPSCQRTSYDIEVEKNNLTKARTALILAMNTNDIDAIMDALSSDHITMAPNEPAYNDPEKLRQWHEYRIEHFNTEFQFEIINTTFVEDYAIDYWMLTTNSVSITENESIMGDSKGIWVWERQADGQWKMLWSIWNENIPAHSTEE